MCIEYSVGDSAAVYASYISNKWIRDWNGMTYDNYSPSNAGTNVYTSENFYRVNFFTDEGTVTWSGAEIINGVEAQNGSLQLAQVVKTRELHRASRRKVPFPIVALVGYTNAGKSTLFNFLTGADVLAKDMLFATLDPTMRGVKLPDGGPEVILSDTVGFISDLPTELVASFRATLEEVLSANLVLHVRDISHPESAEQAKEVQNILTSLGLKEDVPLLEVWNKIDRVDPEAREGMLERARRDELALQRQTHA